MKYRFGLMACAGLAFLVPAENALAADFPPPPPPPPNVQIVDGGQSCIYVRGDVGGAVYQRPSATVVIPPGGAGFVVGNTSAVDEKIDPNLYVEGGIGCQVSDNLRVEVTGGYRMKTSITDPFNSLDADLKTYTGFVNAFWDIVNYNGFTPYMGGGVGVAFHDLSAVRLPAASAPGKNADLAWNIGAGISYDLTRNFKIDVAYRYVDLGVAKSNGASPMTIDDIKAHEIKVGFRYQFGAW